MYGGTYRTVFQIGSWFFKLRHGFSNWVMVFQMGHGFSNWVTVFLNGSSFFPNKSRFSERVTVFQVGHGFIKVGHGVLSTSIRLWFFGSRFSRPWTLDPVLVMDIAICNGPEWETEMKIHHGFSASTPKYHR